MRRAPLGMLALALAAACGKGSDKPAPKEEPAAAAQPATEKRRIATLAPPGTPWMRILTRGAERVSDATDGRVQVDFFFGGVQGDEKDMVRKMKLGQLDGAALTSVGLGMIYPGIRVLQLPGLYASVEELDYVRARSWPYFQERFREKGFELRDSSDIGWVQLLSKSEIKSVADLRAAKVWIWKDDQVTSKIFGHHGIDGVPLGVPDVLAALKTGRVDVVYASPLAAVALQWWTEVQYLTPLNMSYGIGGMVMRQDAWMKSSEADRTIEARVWHETTLELIARIRKDNERALQAMATQGVTVIDAGKKFPDRLQSVNEKVWQELIGELYSQAELDMILAYRKEYRERDGCPSLTAAEDLHAVLALIEHGKPADEVKRRLERARTTLEGETIDATWSDFVTRTGKAAASYAAGRSEKATIEESALRMEFQASTCFVKDVHDVMHQRLGIPAR